MKKSSLNQWAAAGRRQTGSTRAFTLTELLVVMGVMAMLSAVLMSASFTTQEGVLRAQCVSNLRQIGVGLNIYSTEANGYLPICSWPSGQNPWQTDLACRTLSGTGTITRGPMGLGMLWGSKMLPDPRVFYCPSLAKSLVLYSYNYDCYNNSPWPATPPTEVQVRTGYMYYPQSKTLESIPPYHLPSLTYCSVTFKSPNPSDPVQSSLTMPCPIKLTDADPSKAITVDVLMQLAGLAHQNNGQPAGANALFPDGHVKFQPVNGNSGLNQSFYPVLWPAGGGTLGNDPPPSTSFRQVMFYFKP
jgi:prepilin-type N-terminal cleavage/methylation domain-containing protein/prepilin-type processing-associated H-X9-DG protein